MRKKDEGRRRKDEGREERFLLAKEIGGGIPSFQEEGGDLVLGIRPHEEEKPYTLGTWAGMTQWKCKLCPWDTLEGEVAMLEHIASAHKPPPPKILIADKSGREKREA